MISKLKNSIAIMQPYIFPYIGYFQLIQSVEKFVFYDDVYFRKRSWINRNRLYFLNGGEGFFTVPLKKISQNKLIKDIEIYIDKKWINTFYKTLKFSYEKSKKYNDVIDLIMNTFDNIDELPISDLAIRSICNVYEYLDIKLKFSKSSEIIPNYKELRKADRLIKISLSQNCNQYVNLVGGKELYSKNYFAEKGLTLHFIETKFDEYKQLNKKFVSGLSIIDLLMHCEKEFLKETLNSYTLV